jgi:hypothetical protein
MGLTSEEARRVKTYLADELVARLGIDPAWWPSVFEAVGSVSQDSPEVIKLLFRGYFVEKPWSDSVESALTAAAASLDDFATHWRQLHERGADLWDAPPGRHRELGCRCDDGVRSVDGSEVRAYAKSHLQVRSEDGSLSEGRALLLCPFTGLRWEYTWNGDARHLVAIGEPLPMTERPSYKLASPS